MKIVIACAMKEELDFFRQNNKCNILIQKGKTIIEEIELTNNHDIYLLETGIGKVNAAISSTIAYNTLFPDLIINTGSAGGLVMNLKIGDIVVSDTLTYHDVNSVNFGYVLGQIPQMPKNYRINPKYLNVIKNISFKKSFNTHFGLTACGDSFVSDDNLVQALKNNFPNVLALDMESTSIAHSCFNLGIDMINVRGISDIAGSSSVLSFNANLKLASKNTYEYICSIINNL